MTSRDLAPHDAELIAAFIDKRLSEDERQAFLERLDRDEALYEVFVETVRFRDQASAEGGKVLESSAWGRKWALPAAAAALLAVAVATPLLISKLSEQSYAEALVADGRLEPYLGEGWYEQPWSVTRGISPSTREADTAFRIGVRVVDLEVALRTGKDDHARILVARLDSLLESVEFAEGLQSSYVELGRRIEAGSEPAEELNLAQATEYDVGFHLSDLGYAYEFGKWAEAGKLAAQSGNLELLRSRSFRKVLAELQREEWPEGKKKRLALLSKMLAAKELDSQRIEAAFLSIIGES